MANRSFIDSHYSLLKRRIDLFCAVLMGAAGAPLLQKWNYPTLGGGANAYTYTTVTGGTQPSGWPNVYQQGTDGVRSVARTGVGAWTITLQDNYTRLLGLRHTVQNATGVLVMCQIGLVGAPNMAADGGSVINVLVNDFAGAAVDIAADNLVLLELVLQDATEP